MKSVNKRSQVLIIDDEESIRNLCQRALDKIDISSESAMSAEEGLKMIETDQYDVILLDIMLPGMDGLQLLDIIKKRQKDMEVIMLTGNATVNDAVYAMKKGAYDFITKPFELVDIRKTVRKALEKEDLSRRVKELQEVISINNVARAISRLMPFGDLLKTVFDGAKKTLYADEGSITIYSKEKNTLTVMYVDGNRDTEKVGDELRSDERVCGHIIDDLSPILISAGVSDDTRFGDMKEFSDVKSVMCIP
ncbi:response regulator, partial [Elusimicrobiota bacterium]